jgi:aconitate hydratase
MNYLASPPLCVAYALAGTMDIDLASEAIGQDEDGNDVYLRDVWPTEKEIAETIGEAVRADMFRRSYGEVFSGDERWQGLDVPSGERFAWREDSTYVRLPPYFDGMPAQPAALTDIEGARVLAVLGDSVTTDHISPAGAIKRDGPAGAYLQSKGVEPRDFNSYGARRGNHEVMVRGTFANIRLHNLIGGGEALPEGGYTRFLDDSSAEQMSIFEAANRYIEAGTPLVVLAGREYGTGSSRDWAAKGTKLLGVRAVIAQSFERIHRSNLIGMGVLPLQFTDGESAASLGLTGEEVFSITGLAVAMEDGGAPPTDVDVSAQRDGSAPVSFKARVRIDTPREADYFRHGGILQYVLRQLLAA